MPILDTQPGFIVFVINPCTYARMLLLACRTLQRSGRTGPWHAVHFAEQALGAIGTSESHYAARADTDSESCTAAYT